MPRRKAALLILSIVLPLAFALGCVALFAMRFRVGDVYPPYSSMRSDPLGSRVLYDALAEMDYLDKLSVSRNFRSLSHLAEDEPATVFFLGVSRMDVDLAGKNTFQALDAAAASGGRVIIALLAEVQDDLRSLEKTCPQEEKCGNKKAEHKENAGEKAGDETAKKEKPGDQEAGRDKPGKEQTESGDEDEKGVEGMRPRHFETTLEKRWGIRLEKTPAGHGMANAMLCPGAEPDLPKVLPWHTLVSVTEAPKQWHAVYSRGGKPVILERSLGKGSIVLLTDSYLFSNEAMRDTCRPRLLAWLGGDSTRIVFDELHLGVAQSPGVAALARKYRLHGFFAGLLLVFGLYVWANAAPLVPGKRREAVQDFRPPAGDSARGLALLLKRALSPDQAVLECIRQWRESTAAGKRASPEVLKKMRAAVDAEKALPLHRRNFGRAYLQAGQAAREESKRD